MRIAGEFVSQNVGGGLELLENLGGFFTLRSPCSTFCFLLKILQLLPRKGFATIEFFALICRGASGRIVSSPLSLGCLMPCFVPASLGRDDVSRHERINP